jgi:hypothetical protein
LIVIEDSSRTARSSLSISIASSGAVSSAFASVVQRELTTLSTALQQLQIPNQDTYETRLKATSTELWNGLQNLIGIGYVQKQQELREADGTPYTITIPVNQLTLGKNDQHNYSVNVSEAFVDGNNIKTIDARCHWVNGGNARNECRRLMLSGGTQLLYSEHDGGRKWFDHRVTFEPSNHHINFYLSGGGWGKCGPSQRGVYSVTLTVTPNGLKDSAFINPFSALPCPF